MTAAQTMALLVPTEVLDQVCQNLDRSELKNMRLVCRGYHDISTPKLFERLDLKRNMISFSKLQLVATHPLYSKMVKAFSYSGEVFSDFDIIPDYSQWEEWIGSGFVPHDKRTDYKARFTADQLHLHYQQFCDLVVSEKIFRNHDLEFEYLVSALQSLPGLQEICYDSGESRGHRLDYPFSLEYLSTIERATLQSPRIIHGIEQHGRQFRRLVLATIKTQKRMKVLQVNGVFWDSFRQIEKNSGKLVEIMDDCRHFYLNITLGSDLNNNRLLVANMLANASHLQTLEISFGYLYLNEKWLNVRLSQLLQLRNHWPDLRRLKLRAMYVTQEDLQNFLAAHASTLSSLELAKLNMYEEDENTAGEGKSSWPSVILFLQQSLNLTRFRLDELLITTWNEGWKIHDPDDIDYWRGQRCHPPPHGWCLKHRIERFVVEGGECPLILPDNTNDLNPDWQEDDTWLPFRY